MLTKQEILKILDIIGRKVIVAPSDEFPYYVTAATSFGYSEDKEVAGLQAKLSIMLDATRR